MWNLKYDTKELFYEIENRFVVAKDTGRGTEWECGMNIYAGSSMKRPWVLSPTALMCLQRPLALSQIIGRRVSISLSERGREGSVRAYWGWE